MQHYGDSGCLLWSGYHNSYFLVRVAWNHSLPMVYSLFNSLADTPRNESPTGFVRNNLFMIQSGKRAFAGGNIALHHLAHPS